jgi:GTP cyclohydrolase II
MHVPPRVIRPQGSLTEWVAKATLPTRHGNFETHVFRAAPDLDAKDGLSPEHVALVFGDLASVRPLAEREGGDRPPPARQDVLVRVHSECMTSEVFGSLKCDCKEQLEAAMAAIARAGSGAVLYLRQ